MATASSPQMDEEDASRAERYLEQIQQVPLIMELLAQEDIPASSLREAFETLSLVVQGASSDLPKHNTTVTDVIHRLLNAHLSHVHHALNGGNPNSLIISALSLLVAMVTHNQQAARDVIAVLNFRQFLTLVNRTDLKVEEDIRWWCIRLAMAFFVSGDNNVIKQMLTYKDFLKSFFKRLKEDRASNIQLLLVTLSQHLVCNPAVTKTEKLHILNNYTLHQVSMLYAWQGTSEAKAESGDDADYQALEVRQLCHQFLLKVTCDLKHGINFFDSSLGLSGKNHNSMLLKFMLSLPNASNDDLILELIISILRTCPDLLNPYLSSGSLSFQPRPSSSWLMNMRLLKEILSGQATVSSALQQSRTSSVGHIVQLAMANTVPTVLTPVLLSQAVKHSSTIISSCILDTIRLILSRAHGVIQWLRGTSQSAVLAQYQQALIKVLPDVDTYVNLLHRMLDKPPDTDHSHQAAKTEEGTSTGEPDQAKTEGDILMVLLDVLWAYQQTIPQSFALTLYDFSRLPHLLCRPESGSQFPVVQERAFRLLLAFPEGKLRGFKEMKGTEGSTVWLLLKQLTSSSTDTSDLLTLKKKLLEKLVKETGLFAQSAWEIAVWLDTLSKFSPDDGSKVVQIFYRSLTQAIRNPYPFNDHVINAMFSARTVHKSGLDNYSVKGASSPDVLSEITGRATFDLDSDDITAQSENQPMSEAVRIEPLPCSALLPSTLQIFSQLEVQNQSLFGRYVSSVALSILDRQESPLAICFLLHHATQTGGSNMLQDASWKSVMKYYCMWLPPVYRHSDLYKKSLASLSDKPLDRAQDGWSDVLRASLIDVVELCDTDKEKLLGCDKKELMSMTRQLLMYVHTLPVIQPKKVSVILPSYLAMVEKILESVHTADCQQDKDHSVEDDQSTVDKVIPLTDVSHEATTEWWTEMAALVLKHAAFSTCLGHRIASQKKTEVTSDKSQAPNPAVASCFLKCLSLFEQHLPNAQLHSLLRPVLAESFPNLLSAITNLRNLKAGRTKRKQVDDETLKSDVNLFRAVCTYVDDLQLSDAASVLLKTLNEQVEATTASSPGKKQQLHLRTLICHLLNVVAERQKPGKSQQPTSPANDVPEVLRRSDISLLVELGDKLSCDEMIGVLSQLLEENLELASLFTDSIFTDWLDNPSEAKVHLLSLLLRDSKEHVECFDGWCQETPTDQLGDNKCMLLPLVLSYFTHGSPSTDDQTVHILHTAYWSWLEKWILHHKDQDEEKESNHLKSSVLIQLLSHSTQRTLQKYLQKFVEKGQEKGHVSFSRFQLKACQLSVERLVSQELEGKSSTTLQDVIVACSQSLVSVIKTTPEDSTSELKDHLFTLSEVVKAAEGKLPPASTQLIQAWKSLVRNGLKHHFQSSDMLRLLACLVTMIYSKPDLKEGGRGEDGSLDTETDPLGNLIPLSVLYQILLSHSLFLPTLLEGKDDSISEVKESLVKLMLTIVELDPQCCHASHFPVLVGGYNATMSVSDTALLMLMRHYQLNQAVPPDYRFTAWGQIAVSQYQTQRLLGKSLWQQPTMKEILHQLEADNLRRTALQFPLRRKLQMPYDSSASSSSSALYDPCFLLPLFSHLLAPECLVDCARFIQTNALAMTLAGLSSFDADMRRASYHVMASLLDHLEHARFRGRREVYYLLQCLKNSVVEPNMRVPSVVGTFVARASALMLTPESSMYPVILQYLLIKPQLQMNAVPMFMRLFYSSGFKHEDECLWMLSLLQDGLRDSADVILYNRSTVFMTLMACYQSRLATKQLKDAILSLISVAFDVEEGKRSLTRQLLPSLQAAVDAGDTSPGENVASLMQKLLAGTKEPISQQIIKQSLAPAQPT